MQFSKTMNEKSFETFCSQNYSGENLQFSKFFKKFTILATKKYRFSKTTITIRPKCNFMHWYLFMGP